MSRLIYIFLPLLLFSCRDPHRTPADNPPVFRSVREAIAFIEKKVEAGDTRGLIDACVDEYATIKSNPFADHILDELSLLDLRALYGDEVFPGQWPCLLKELLDIIKELFGLDVSRILKLKPTCPSSFKLGGHGDAYNHIHIDFVSRPDGWYLSNVWQCR